MIGKISSGKGFGGTVAYVLGPGEHNVEDRARVIWHTMSSDNHEHWAIEMEEHARALNPDLVASGRSDLVVHVSLSAAPGERLSDVQWIGVASQYLKEMGWDGHDHIIVQHNDRPHDHIHLIINRVGQDGQTADLHHDYQRQAAALEKIEKHFGLSESHSLMRQAAEHDPSKAIDSIIKSHLTFEARDVERYFTRLGFDNEKAKELTGRALAGDTVLGTEEGKYTTAEIQKEVRNLNDRFAELAGRTHGALVDFAPSVSPGRELSDDQQRGREAIAEGQDLTVVRGIAGAGKSTMLEQSRADLEQSGYRVLGAAPTGKAAAGLHASSGIESSTIASLLGKLDRGSVSVDDHTVLVVDEAGMARLDDISRLADHISQVGGRLVLVGDDRQLQAVGRGGALGLAEQHVGSTTLNQIWRQADSKDDNGNVIVDRQWMRDATKAFGEGRTAEALQAYVDRNHVKWSASVGSSIRDMILDYAQAFDYGKRPEQMLAMAHRNEHVDKLNHGIREALKDRGLLQDARTYDLTRGSGKSDIELAVGDRVVLTKNPPKSLGINEEDVKNGMFGTVKALSTEDHQIDIQLDKGSFVRLDLDQFGHIAHGYASTVHKAQGASIEQTFGLASGGMDSHLAYVVLTRHIEWTKLYANTVDFKGVEQLIEKLSKANEIEKFSQIIAASFEQKLKNAYGMDEQQVERYMQLHPRLMERLEALGIGPERQKSYLEDVIDVLEKHLGSLEMPSLGSDGPPGLDAFRDAFREWRASLDAWKYDPLVPMNRTEQVIYAVLDGAVSAVWNGLSSGVQKGLSDEPGLLADLLRVTGQHLGAALEAGIEGAPGKIGDAITGSKHSSELVERLVEREPGSDKGEQPGKHKDQQQGQSREHEGNAGKGEQQEQRSGDEKGGQSNGREKDQNKGESQRHGQSQDAGRRESQGRGGERQSDGRQPEGHQADGGRSAEGRGGDQSRGEQQERAGGSDQGRNQAGRGEDTSRGGERQSAGRGSEGHQAEGRGQEQHAAGKGEGQQQDRAAGKGESQEQQRDQGKNSGQGARTPDKGPAPQKTATPAKDAGETKDGHKQTAPAPRQDKAQSKGQQQNKTQGKNADKSKDASKGKDSGKTKDGGKSAAEGQQRQTKTADREQPQTKSAGKSTGKAPTKGKGKTAAKSKAVSKDNSSSNARDYGRERYR